MMRKAVCGGVVVLRGGELHVVVRGRRLCVLHVCSCCDLNEEKVAFEYGTSLFFSISIGLLHFSLKTLSLSL